MKKIYLIILFLLVFFSSFAQKYRVSGYVYDVKTKESLIGATIYNPNTKQGTITNAYGFYSFSSKDNNLTIEISFVGYQKQTITLNLKKDTIIDLYLSASTDLQEVVITDKIYEQRFVRENIPGKIEVSPQMVMKMPTLTGEADLLKAIQMLPGVKSGTEGTTGLYVRGGNIDENLYLIDGIEVYNPNHLMGFISAFNTDAIKTINFYKGGFPSEFGGRVSSVMDVRMNDGNNQKIKGDVSIGLISAKLNVEGPIIKDKTTFSLSARRTYLDLLLKPIIAYENKQNDENLDFAYHFYDINAKIKHHFSTKNTLTASFYMGNDSYGFSDDDEGSGYDKTNTDVKWGNIIATLDFTHQFSAALFSNVSLSYNRYKSLITSSYESIGRYTYTSTYDFNSGIEDITLKNNYNYYLNAWNSFNFGINYIFHHYTPETTQSYSTTNGNYDTKPYLFKNQENAHEFVAYIEDIMTFGDKLSLREGLRLDFYIVNNTTHTSIQPRLSARYSIMDNISLKVSYAMMNQNIHLLANGIFSLPTDLWIPVTKNIKPITSHQVSCGTFLQLFNGIDFSLEGYYKILNNVIDYKDGISSFNNSDGWEDKVAQGDGKAYGMEFTAQRNKGKITGWISYTLSWSKRKYPNGEINNGEEFYDRFDARHQFNAALSWEINKRWDITAAFVINSGSRTNVAIAQYYIPDYNNYGALVDVYGAKNNFRLPSYQRLDLSIANHKTTKHGIRTWSLNVYNAYNHKNAFFVTTTNKPNKLKAICIMPIIPTISYSYKF